MANKLRTLFGISMIGLGVVITADRANDIFAGPQIERQKYSSLSNEDAISLRNHERIDDCTVSILGVGLIIRGLAKLEC